MGGSFLASVKEPASLGVLGGALYGLKVKLGVLFQLSFMGFSTGYLYLSTRYDI